MAVVPAATPITMPDVPTVATVVFDDDQTPPTLVLLNVRILPTHTDGVPVIVPATGKGLTVISVVAKQPVAIV
jgi:hypothetical protein